MSDPARFHVKGWEKHQHYKSRRPPWIKLHRTLLDDKDFHRLHVASRALAPMLWLLASESMDGTVTADPHDLAFQLRRSVDEVIEAVKPLLAAGFLSASGVLATCYQNAVREETETEERTTEEKRIAVAPLQPSNGKAGTWNQAACGIVTARYGGTAPGGRITKALRPLVGRHGEETVLSAWSRYIDETEAEYLSPERFATTFSNWSGQARAPASAKMREAEARSRASMLGGLKGDGSVMVGGLGSDQGLLPGSGQVGNGRGNPKPELPEVSRLSDGAPVGARRR